jgi:hypothetical protein
MVSVACLRNGVRQTCPVSIWIESHEMERPAGAGADDCPPLVVGEEGNLIMFKAARCSRAPTPRNLVERFSAHRLA